MISFSDLKGVLAATVRWEQKLKDFYDVAEFAMKSRESKEAVVRLRENHMERLSVLENVDVARFGSSEWIRFAPAYDDEDIVPVHGISRDSTPSQVVDRIVSCEKNLRDFYAAVATHLISRDQKDLFASLVTFKDNQIAQIEQLLD